MLRFRPSPLVLLLAASSGAAALIHEIVWFQLLELSIGSSSVSLAALLVAFMGGAGLGGLLFPRFVSKKLNPAYVYAAIEIGVGLLGLLMLLAIPLIGKIYTGTGWALNGMTGLIVRGAIAAMGLGLPALCIGATLPALARCLQGAASRASWLGAIYAVNILGGTLGCLAAGFYLLREYDATTAACAAAGLNAAVAVLSFLLPTPPLEDSTEETSPKASPETVPISIYAITALSGFCALAGEAIWTRLLALLFGASVYGFTLILAVFLTGLGAGGLLGSVVAKRTRQPLHLLGWLQIFGGSAIAWSAYNLSYSLPFWPTDPSAAADIGQTWRIDFLHALWVLLPPTLVWGAGFPLALAAAAPKNRENARLMGRVYAANTLGSLVGAVAGSLVLIAWLGSVGSERLLIGVSTMTGLVILLAVSGQRTAVAPLTLLSILLIVYLPPIPGTVLAHGRYASTWKGRGDIVFAREGMNATVAVSDFPGVRTFHVAGKIQASSAPRDMRLQRMLGHMTTLAAKNPRSVLVIGCGAGVTAGAVSIDPRVERTTIAELEPLVPKTASTYFAKENFGVILNPKTQVYIDDGRHFLLTSRERFDAITADPLDPWVKGAANLYTLEFLEAAKERLNPGGAVTLYIQLFETNSEAVKSAIATFVQVFPDATVWGNPVDGRGHDMFLLGTREPLTIDLDAMEERWHNPAFTPLVQSLDDVGIRSWVDLLATYAGRGPDLSAWLEGAAINRDRNLRLQYLAGLALDRDDAAPIYASMLRYRRFPSSLFTGSPSRLAQIQ